MKRVISIVEDEKDINNLVAQYLRKEGYEVHSYYTYEEASAHVADDDVHLWILDIMLDDKSGLENVWDENYFGSDRVVDDTLRRLRKKLPNLNIHTIYGYGYRLG